MFGLLVLLTSLCGKPKRDLVAVVGVAGVGVCERRAVEGFREAPWPQPLTKRKLEVMCQREVKVVVERASKRRGGSGDGVR